MKSIQDFNTSEVSLWLISIGLASKVEEFQSNDIDGPTLAQMSTESLIEQLHCSKLQARRILKERDLLISMNSSNQLEELQNENARLLKKVSELKDVIRVLNSADDSSSSPATAALSPPQGRGWRWRTPSTDPDPSAWAAPRRTRHRRHWSLPPPVRLQLRRCHLMHKRHQKQIPFHRPKTCMSILRRQQPPRPQEIIGTILNGRLWTTMEPRNTAILPEWCRNSTNNKKNNNVNSSRIYY